MFGLGKRRKSEADSERERSADGSERSVISRQDDVNSDCRSDNTSVQFSEDNSSLYYDNDSTNEYFEKTIVTNESKNISESKPSKSTGGDCPSTLKNHKQNEIDSDKKDDNRSSKIFITCNEYVTGRDKKGRDYRELDSVPPDIILSSNRPNSNVTETVVIREFIERQVLIDDAKDRVGTSAGEDENRIANKSPKSNDLNNNKSGDKRREAFCSTDNTKTIRTFHSADECKIDETARDNSDRKQIAVESVECIPERTVNLCKAIVSFEDGGCRNIDSAKNSDRPFIVLEDDVSLTPKIRIDNSDSSGEVKINNGSECSIVDGSPLPMYYIPVRRYLDVIKEEPSDISSDSEKNRDSVPLVKISDHDNSNTADEWHADGIDTSWRDGKSLDDLSDVPIASDSLSDTDVPVADSKPPKYVPPDVYKKSIIKSKINQNYLKTDTKVPSVNVVKSVVACYYNNKSTALEIDDVKSVRVPEKSELCPSLTKTPNEGEEVEFVYIDSSDSDVVSLKSDKIINGSSSNISSLEDILSVSPTSSNSKKNDIDKCGYSVKNQVLSSRCRDCVKSPRTCACKISGVFENDKYAEDLIELSQTIISEIAENLSSGANSRLTSARSTPCRLLSARSTPSKEILSRSVGSMESIKSYTHEKRDEEIAIIQRGSSVPASSNPKCLLPVPPLRKLSADVIFDLPNGKYVLKELGIDPPINYDSGSDYFAETSEYSDPSRLSFNSADEIYGVCSRSGDLTHQETDPDRPLSSCASSIVFITGSTKAVVEPWIGLPLSEDPRLVVCFSPSQLSSSSIKIDQQKASELFDIHKKFIHRRGYHEESAFKIDEPDLISVETNSVADNERNVPEILSEAANLLALQEYRNERVRRSKTDEIANSDTEDNRCIEHKELNLGSGGDDRKGGTKFRSEHNEEEIGSSRLLELIQKEDVRSPTSPERSVLVKKPLTTETDTPSEFAPPDFDSDEYTISKRGDIAIRKSKRLSEEKVRPKSLPPSSEIFRRKMYEEYMDKVAERLERRQMKLIKVSDCPTGTETGSDKSKHLEAEFMNKVRERMEKLGLKENEDEGEDSKQDREERSSSSLPKHIKELVEILNEDNGKYVHGTLETNVRACVQN